MPPTSLNAANTHSAIAFQYSSRVTTTFNAHCTVHCIVGDFNVILAKNSKEDRYDTVPYDEHDITCRSATYWINELLAISLESNEIAETGGTLFYTANPFRY